MVSDNGTFQEIVYGFLFVFCNNYVSRTICEI